MPAALDITIEPPDDAFDGQIARKKALCA